jgi:DNA-directed RNA polymerase specialized sigma24 family protein
LRLPIAVEGIIDAVRQSERGDASALETWHRAGYPILLSVLARWSKHDQHAGHLAGEISEQALTAVRKGHAIRSERGWMARIASRGLARLLSSDKTTPLPADLNQLPAATAQPLLVLIREENRARVRTAIAGLPTEYKFVLTLRYISGRTEQDTCARTEKRYGIGRGGTRCRLQAGLEMVKITLEGRSPRACFPWRYAGSDKKSRSASQTPEILPHKG